MMVRSHTRDRMSQPKPVGGKKMFEQWERRKQRSSRWLKLQKCCRWWCCCSQAELQDRDQERMETTQDCGRMCAKTETMRKRRVEMLTTNKLNKKTQCSEGRDRRNKLTMNASCQRDNMSLVVVRWAAGSEILLLLLKAPHRSMLKNNYTEQDVIINYAPRLTSLHDSCAEPRNVHWCVPTYNCVHLTCFIICAAAVKKRS